MMNICTVDNCGNNQSKRSLCRKHYKQAVVSGELRTIQTPNDFIIEDGICKIVCYNIKHEIVGCGIIDLEDVERCKQHKWHFNKRYVVSTKKNKQTPHLFLHHFIMNVVPSRTTVVDHRNGDGKDNRKCNLRVCTYSENTHNTKLSCKNTSGYRGVFLNKNKDGWCAQIRKDGIVYHLGTFNNKEDAATERNKKAIELHGEFAVLNIIPVRLKLRKLT